MKKILIATDLTENARHTAVYAYHLARQLQAQVLLCYVMNVPAEIPQNVMVSWPVDLYDDMSRESEKELDKLRSELTVGAQDGGYQPEVNCIHDAGLVCDVVNAQAVAHGADLILMGTHSNDSLTTLMIGNHARKMIDAAATPLLLVPPGSSFRPIKKMAFASDFRQPAKDIKAIRALADLARSMRAEIVLAHVDQQSDDPAYDGIVRELLTGLIEELDHKAISCDIVKCDRAEEGLIWLAQHADIDILAMAHRHHSLLRGLLIGSHTQKAARQLPVPLLVLKSE